ncbi:hypothetical protein [Massilia sp. MS-15]|uniref:hypothetical protein n=1 Tax=Massilia sp. MS-15 TaxID=2878200 RepID=UPI001CD42407|nr:hypothetical protein [Massilia sp. MS-15]MCA1248201.1 hypothetical protein [Massilia sp. MS-15]
MKSCRSVAADPQALCTVLRHARHALCQRVARAAATPDRMFAAEFPALVVAVEDGFRREELTMEALGIPGLRERREHNALILSALHHVSPAVERGCPETGREVVSALRDLLNLHRHAADLVLAVSALQQRTRVRAPNGVRGAAARRGIAA